MVGNGVESGGSRRGPATVALGRDAPRVSDLSLGYGLGGIRRVGRRNQGGRSNRILLGDDPTAPVLPTGPSHLGHLVSDVAMIPAQTTRDLVHRVAAHEHVAQLVQLPVRPLSAGVLGRLFVLRLGPVRIEDGCANQAQ
jgi:hypothetical protein